MRMPVSAHRSRAIAAEVRGFALGVGFSGLCCLLLLLCEETRAPWRRAASSDGGEPVRPRQLRGHGGESAENATDGQHPSSELPPCKAPEEEQPSLIANLPLSVSIPVIVALIMFSGLFSGLTLGLMGLDLMSLQIVERGGNEELAWCAAKIAPLRENGNLLLCTLLLGNVAVNSALSILTADMFSGVAGLLISTVLIVIFGEILPQACCSRFALQIGARAVPIVKVLICLFYLVTRPMSIALDWLLGHEMGTVMSRNEIMEMLKLQVELGAVNPQVGMMAKQVAEGAISFRDKRVVDIVTPLEDTYMLSSETRLGYKTIREIFETGFSRVPVFGKDRHDYVGLLYTKDLMLVDPEDEMRLEDFIAIFHRKVETFFKDTKLVDALNAFKKGGTHIGLVRQPITEVDTDLHFEIVGLLTLEDIVEEIIQEEIIDETDVYVDVDRGIKVCDGREKEHLNLGVFNPRWAMCGQRLSRDEVAAVGAHLHRVLFGPGPPAMGLSMEAVEYLVATSEVRTQKRVSEVGSESSSKEDWLYLCNEETQGCTLVLQGRLTVVAGRDGFRSEAGAFSILAKDALLPGKAYSSDFGAHLSTAEVRFLVIHRDHFKKAQDLDIDKKALQRARCAAAAQRPEKEPEDCDVARMPTSFVGSQSQADSPSTSDQGLPDGTPSTLLSSRGHCQNDGSTWKSETWV